MPSSKQHIYAKETDDKIKRNYAGWYLELIGIPVLAKDYKDTCEASVVRQVERREIILLYFG